MEFLPWLRVEGFSRDASSDFPSVIFIDASPNLTKLKFVDFVEFVDLS